MTTLTQVQIQSDNLFIYKLDSNPGNVRLIEKQICLFHKIYFKKMHFIADLKKK